VKFAATASQRPYVALAHRWQALVVADGNIFIATNNREGGGVVMGLEEATGRELWKLNIPRLVTKWRDFNYDDMNLGVCSTPTVADRRLYVVSNRDEMLCLDLDGRSHGAEPDVARLIAGSEQPPMTLDSKAVGIVWRFQRPHLRAGCRHRPRVVAPCDRWPDLEFAVDRGRQGICRHRFGRPVDLRRLP
jgi:hypothetical protein